VLLQRTLDAIEALLLRMDKAAAQEHEKEKGGTTGHVPKLVGLPHA
jgi:hypothetical protein